MLDELTKQKISDDLTVLSSDYNDDELDYAIEVLNFWKSERIRQNKELEELYGKGE